MLRAVNSLDDSWEMVERPKASPPSHKEIKEAVSDALEITWEERVAPVIELFKEEKMRNSLRCCKSDQRLHHAVVLIPCAHRLQQEVARALFGKRAKKKAWEVSLRNRHCPSCRASVLGYLSDGLVRQVAKEVYGKTSLLGEKRRLICPLSGETLDRAVILVPCAHRVQQQVAEKFFGKPLRGWKVKAQKSCSECGKFVVGYIADHWMREVARKEKELWLQRQRFALELQTSFLLVFRRIWRMAHREDGERVVFKQCVRQVQEKAREKGYVQVASFCELFGQALEEQIKVAGQASTELEYLEKIAQFAQKSGYHLIARTLLSLLKTRRCSSPAESCTRLLKGPMERLLRWDWFSPPFPLREAP